jgi:hypothetical protein
MFRSRRVVISVLAPLALLLGSVVAAPPSGASTHQSASSSAFCKTIAKFAVAQPPVYITISTYHVWAKLYLPSYEKLASEAPTASVKKLLDDVVAVMKYEEKATSVSKLQKYVTANSALWKKSVSQLFKSNIACATNM